VAEQGKIGHIICAAVEQATGAMEANMSEISGSKLGTIELFCKAAEMASFSAAAAAASTTPSAVSKAVRRLEDQLGVRLFERTTRAVRLTAEGISYHASCSEALQRIRQAGASLTQSRGRPRGALRVSMPPSFGIVDFVPRLRAYFELYPTDIKVHASLTNSISALVDEGFDIAIRIGKVADSRLIARTLFDSRIKVVASPAYLQRWGDPRRPEDLRSHRCIDLILPDTKRAVAWEFGSGRRKLKVPVAAALSVDHPLAAVSAAVAGCGIARLLDFSVSREIAAGRLAEVLSGYAPPAVPVSIVYPGSRHVGANVRTFVDFAVESYSRSAGPPL
jgi:DNA-binding transcriptional LysR family regulator